jgi:hypothetical protein
VIDKDRQASTDAHGGTHIATTGGTKRSRSYDDGEDNTDSTPSKQVKSVDDEIETCLLGVLSVLSSPSS